MGFQGFLSLLGGGRSLGGGGAIVHYGSAKAVRLSESRDWGEKDGSQKRVDVAQASCSMWASITGGVGGGLARSSPDSCICLSSPRDPQLHLIPTPLSLLPGCHEGSLPLPHPSKGAPAIGPVTMD